MNIQTLIQRTLVRGFAVVTALAAFHTAAAKETVFEGVPLGIESYIYGYPLVTMEMTRRVMTNVEKPEGSRAPMGQFVRMREYPSAAYRDVTAPNADTLYTTVGLMWARSRGC